MAALRFTVSTANVCFKTVTLHERNTCAFLAGRKKRAMGSIRVLIDLIGVIFFVVGLFLLMGSCALCGHAAGHLSLWFGASLLAAGAIICRAANRRTCPECAERVKFAALKCEHCGHTFATTEHGQQTSISQPFYKLGVAEEKTL